MNLTKFLLPLSVELTVFSGFIGVRGYQYVTNFTSFYEEVGTGLNSRMPRPFNLLFKLRYFLCGIITGLILLYSLPGYAQNPITPPKTLQTQGMSYPQACTKPESKRIEADVRRIAGSNRDPDQAWQLIHTLLCQQSTPANVNYVLQHMASRIVVSSYMTGDEKEEVKRKARSREFAQSMFREKAAWDTTVQQEGGGIAVSYHSDEACVEGPTLHYKGKTWQVVKFDGACD